MSQAAPQRVALTLEQAKEHLSSLEGWSLSADGKEIHKRYEFSNFEQALAFVNRLGAVAEKKNHHPDLTLGWGYAGVTFTTHDIGGLHENDFAMAKASEIAFNG